LYKIYYNLVDEVEGENVWKRHKGVETWDLQEVHNEKETLKTKYSEGLVILSLLCESLGSISVTLRMSRAFERNQCYRVYAYDNNLDNTQVQSENVKVPFCCTMLP
jgi:hypothetical protein